MDALTRPIVPPAPPVHAGELPTWRLVWESLSNLAGFWAEDAFVYLVARRKSLGVDSIVINDPEAVRQVMGPKAAAYGRPAAFIRPIRPLGGEGVLLADGTEWRRQRRLLAPVFTPARMGGLIPHFTAAAEGLLARLSGRANLSVAFHEAALDAVLRALFSLPPGRVQADLAKVVRDYIKGPGRPNLLDGLSRSESDFPLAGWSRRRFAKRWHKLVDAVIAERRASPDAEAHDLLGLLLSARDPETGKPLSDVEIRDQSATMLVAGFETTSRLLFWSSYLLALDPIEQERVRAEIAARPPEMVTTLEDLQAWPRLRQVLMETLRLYPPVAVILRQATAEDEIVGEKIGPGCLVWISPWVMHRHKSFWDNPTAFMPERFAGKPNAFLTEPAFLPFGAGPRICIGASFAMTEASVILANVLGRFHIGLESERPVLPVATVTTAPDHEPWFTLEPVEP